MEMALLFLFWIGPAGTMDYSNDRNGIGPVDLCEAAREGAYQQHAERYGEGRIDGDGDKFYITCVPSGTSKAQAVISEMNAMGDEPSEALLKQLGLIQGEPA